MSDKGRQSKVIIINKETKKDTAIVTFTEFRANPGLLTAGSVVPSNIIEKDPETGKVTSFEVFHLYYLWNGSKWFYFKPDGFEDKIHCHGIKVTKGSTKAHCAIFKDPNHKEAHEEAASEFFQALEERRLDILYEVRYDMGYADPVLIQTPSKKAAPKGSPEEQNERNRDAFYTSGVKTIVWLPSNEVEEEGSGGRMIKKKVLDQERPHVSFGIVNKVSDLSSDPNRKAEWNNTSFYSPIEEDGSGGDAIPLIYFIEINGLQKIRGFDMVPAFSIIDFKGSGGILPQLKIKEADVWPSAAGGGIRKRLLHDRVVSKPVLTMDTSLLLSQAIDTYSGPSPDDEDSDTHGGSSSSSVGKSPDDAKGKYAAGTSVSSGYPAPVSENVAALRSLLRSSTISS